jgi:hypothetical protein
MTKSKFQIFVENTIQSLLSILKIAVFSKSVTSYKKLRGGDSCIVLGNGPSLNKSMKEHPVFFSSRHLFAVNHFASSDYYTQLKPEYYVLNATEMWNPKAYDKYVKMGETLFTQLAEKTEWPLHLFINSEAAKYSKWKKILASNRHIRVYYFNAAPVEGFQTFEHFCYQKNLGMPRPHNVLIPSLIIALNLKFKKIYIAGADHNWMKDMMVDENNRVYLTQKHFYDEKTAQKNTMHKRGTGVRRMHEVLQKFAHSFESYLKIRAYADKLGIPVINLTEGSFIDAFEREKLSEK